MEGAIKDIVLAQFNKPASYEQYTILTNNDGRWSESRRAIAGGLAEAMLCKISNNRSEKYQ